MKDQRKPVEVRFRGMVARSGYGFKLIDDLGHPLYTLPLDCAYMVGTEVEVVIRQLQNPLVEQEGE